MRNPPDASPAGSIAIQKVNGMSNVAPASTGGKGSRRPDAIPAPRLFHERVRRLHQLGPRPVGELLGEIVARYPRIGPFVDERLAVLAGLDPAWLRWTGSADWIDKRDLIRLVGGRS
jgi:hypothetical protein